MCKMITVDNGGEFADHAAVARALKCKIYFAKSCHSWQRDLNDNTNGLLRRYFPNRDGNSLAIGPENQRGCI